MNGEVFAAAAGELAASLFAAIAGLHGYRALGGVLPGTIETAWREQWWAVGQA